MSGRPRRSKYEALRVPCPRCAVYEWRMCVRKDGTERKAFHVERHSKARAEGGKPSKRKPIIPNKEWAKKRAEVFALKGNKCVYCGDDAWHVDHKTPKVRGGNDDIDNLVPACGACNIAKGMMTAEEWRG